jgi:hypothetical protein
MRGVTGEVTASVVQAPAVLTIQLKRFSFLHLWGGKISRHINFPETLDVGPFMSDARNKEHAPVLYDLYGVVVHQGHDLHSGHYYSYVKTGGNWTMMDDASVTPVSIKHVLRDSAYVLMYTRRVPKGASPKLTAAASVELPTLLSLEPSSAVSTASSSSMSDIIDDLEDVQQHESELGFETFATRRRERNRTWYPRWSVALLCVLIPVTCQTLSQ